MKCHNFESAAIFGPGKRLSRWKNRRYVAMEDSKTAKKLALTMLEEDIAWDTDW